MREAGGVGGLLSITRHSTLDTLYPSYDGNGNITSYIDASGTKVDEVVYSPFGKIVSGSLSVCPFGFSSKYVDEEDGLVYYGYRYYDSGNGRWLNRDPMNEVGFKTAYKSLSENEEKILWYYIANNPYKSLANKVNGVIDPDGRSIILIGGIPFIIVGGIYIWYNNTDFYRTVKKCTIFIAYGHHFRSNSYSGLQRVHWTIEDPETSFVAFIGCYASDLNNPNSPPGYTPVSVSLSSHKEGGTPYLGGEQIKARNAARKKAKQLIDECLCDSVNIIFESFGLGIIEKLNWPKPPDETATK